MPHLVHDRQRKLTILHGEHGPLTHVAGKLQPPSKQTWYVRVQGTCVEVSCLKNYSPISPEIERGVVGDMSRESRMRLMRFLNKIDYGNMANSLFVTVTYPDKVECLSYRLRSRHRYLFLRHLERHLGRKVATVWRCEWKQRQTGERAGQLMPHYHYMLLGVNYLPWQVVREEWAATLGYEGPLATDVRKIEGREGVAKYIGKYLSKGASLDIAAYRNSGVEIGRHWGVTRKDLIPLAPLRVMRALTETEVAQLRAYASGKLKFYRLDTGGSFTLFGADVARTIGDKFG